MLKGREAKFRIRILALYDYTCALTGYRLTTVNGVSIVDAAAHPPIRRQPKQRLGQRDCSFEDFALAVRQGFVDYLRRLPRDRGANAVQRVRKAGLVARKLPRNDAPSSARSKLAAQLGAYRLAP